MTFKGEFKDIVRTFENGFVITIKTKDNNLPEDEINSFLEAKNGVKVDIAKWHEKRSVNANAYCWKLLDEIAKKIKSTKEEVYKTIIKRVGIFEVLPIKNVAVKSFIKKWQGKGVGWVCETLGSSKIPNYTNIIAYFGTSTYDTSEMARFIDEVVEEAKGLNIQTETPEKIAEMKSLWSSYEKQDK